MIIDLTQTLEEGMPIYPGTEAPSFAVPVSYEQVGYKETRMQLTSHVGTHLDCPGHVYPDGLTTDRMPIDQFYGSGVVLDCSSLGENGIIGVEILDQAGSLLNHRDFILFYTGWAKRWGSPAYFDPFPSFSEEAITRLARMNIKGIGLDAISIDPVDATRLTNHLIYLKEPKVAVENLTGLDKLLGKDFQFACFPLKLKNGDGSPVRAVAVL